MTEDSKIESAGGGVDRLEKLESAVDAVGAVLTSAIPEAQLKYVAVHSVQRPVLLLINAAAYVTFLSWNAVREISVPHLSAFLPDAIDLFFPTAR